MANVEFFMEEADEHLPPQEAPAGLPPSRRLEVITALCALAASAGLVLLSRQITVRTETGGIDPRWWPTLVGSLALALSVALLIVVLTRTMPRDDIEPTSKAGWARVAVTVTAAVAYTFLWPAIGYVPATLLVLIILTAAFGARNWKVLVLFPVGLTAFLYLLFGTLLKVPL